MAQQYEREAAARARSQALAEAPDVSRLPVASAEDVVLAKLEWFRLGGETSERQGWDVLGVLKVPVATERALRDVAAALLCI